VKIKMGTGQIGLLQSTHFSGDQIGNIGERIMLLQRHEVRFYLAGSHKVNAGQENSIDIQQRLNTPGIFFLRQFPLGTCESNVVVQMMFGDTLLD
jgi:hypothetical protein